MRALRAGRQARGMCIACMYIVCTDVRSMSVRSVHVTNPCACVQAVVRSPGRRRPQQRQPPSHPQPPLGLGGSCDDEGSFGAVLGLIALGWPWLGVSPAAFSSGRRGRRRRPTAQRIYSRGEPLPGADSTGTWRLLQVRRPSMSVVRAGNHGTCGWPALFPLHSFLFPLFVSPFSVLSFPLSSSPPFSAGFPFPPKQFPFSCISPHFNRPHPGIGGRVPNCQQIQASFRVGLASAAEAG